MAEKQKPGVVLYFNPMLEEVDKLDDSQLATLIRALLYYAAPDIRQEPQFTDPELDKVWPFIRNLVDRDQVRYDERGYGKAYSQFCRWFKHFRGYDTGISRPMWEDMGRPNYKTFDGSVYDTDAAGTADTNVENVDTKNTNVWTSPDTNPGTNSRTNTDSNSNSQTETDTSGVSPPPQTEAVPRPLAEALRDWKEFQREKYRPVTAAAEKSLLELMKAYAARYSAESVAALVKHSISNQWKNIPWDRLERAPDFYQRKGGGGNGHRGGTGTASGGGASERGWNLPTVDLDTENAD